MGERFEFSFGSGRAPRPRDDERPMRLLVAGDFSGAPASERSPLGERPTLRADVDTLERVMRRVGVRIVLPSGDIHISQIEDFHPDRLIRLDLFEALRQARTNPPADTDDTIGRLLGRAPDSSPSTAASPASPVDAFIHRIVAPHIVRGTSTQGTAYAAAVDGAIAEVMRAVLHDPAFQSIEAAWRGVHWLVSSLELDEHLQVHLFDVRREELVRDTSTRAATWRRRDCIGRSWTGGGTSPAPSHGRRSWCSRISAVATRMSACLPRSG
jgi:hypothetical protein